MYISFADIIRRAILLWRCSVSEFFFWCRHRIKIFKKGFKKRCISTNVWPLLFWQNFIIFLTNQISQLKVRPQSPVSGSNFKRDVVLITGYDCACWMTRNDFVFTIHRARNAHSIKKHLKSIPNLKSVLHNFENDSRLNESNWFCRYSRSFCYTYHLFAYAK